MFGNASRTCRAGGCRKTWLKDIKDILPIETVKADVSVARMTPRADWTVDGEREFSCFQHRCESPERPRALVPINFCSGLYLLFTEMSNGLRKPLYEHNRTAIEFVDLIRCLLKREAREVLMN